MMKYSETSVRLGSFIHSKERAIYSTYSSIYDFRKLLLAAITEQSYYSNVSNDVLVDEVQNLHFGLMAFWLPFNW